MGQKAHRIDVSGSHKMPMQFPSSNGADAHAISSLAPDGAWAGAHGRRALGPPMM